jgi:hypothetical protein
VTFVGGQYKRITIRVEDGKTHNELRSLILNGIGPGVQLSIDSLKAATSFLLSDCHHIQSIRIGNSILNKMSIAKSAVVGLAEFSMNAITTKAIIADCLIYDLLFNTTGVASHTYINGLKVTNKFHCENGKLATLIFSGSNEINTFELNATSVVKLIINSGEFNHFTVASDTINNLQVFHNEKGKQIVFKEQLVIKQNATETLESIKLRDILCNRLILQGYRNKRNFELMDSRILRELWIRNSNLKPSENQKAVFNNVDLQSIRRFVLFNTNIVGSEFFLVRWNSNYRLHKLEEEIRGKSVSNKLDHYWTIKESYRQLKIVSIQNHNKIDANFFQRGELDVYFDILRLKAFHQGMENGRKYLADFCILFFSKYFGGYGFDIWKPIIWWAVVHSLLFGLLIHLAKFDLRWIGWDLSRFDLESTRKAAALYINLLSPVHGTEYYGHSIFGITDSIIRIASGFFIYYIIRASRKFIFSLG